METGTPFDEAMAEYAFSVWHHDLKGMRMGYVRLRDLFAAQFVQAPPPMGGEPVARGESSHPYTHPAQPEPILEPTDAMVDAYLAANTAYWQEVDELPPDLTKEWRQGTPREATRVSLRAALMAATGGEPVAPVAWARETAGGLAVCYMQKEPPEEAPWAGGNGKWTPLYTSPMGAEGQKPTWEDLHGILRGSGYLTNNQACALAYEIQRKFAAAPQEGSANHG
jgi:hypothetical protein